MRRPKSQGRSFVVGAFGPAACCSAASCMRMTLACQTGFPARRNDDVLDGGEFVFRAAHDDVSNAVEGSALYGGRLDERLRRFHCTLDDIASFVDSVSDLTARAFDRLLSLLAETLCLLFEVVGCIFEVVACVLDALAELFAGFDAGLRSVKKSDCSSCSDSDSKSEPVTFCAHYDVTSCPCRACLGFGFPGLAIGWLFHTVSRGWVCNEELVVRKKL